MEFYEGTDELWESDLDPHMPEILKISSLEDYDCIMDRDSKLPAVILHDKLISDASFGTLPIKTEHSYSLNSDGDSIPESPRSLQNKMDDIDDIDNDYDIVLTTALLPTALSSVVNSAVKFNNNDANTINNNIIMSSSSNSNSLNISNQLLFKSHISNNNSNNIINSNNNNNNNNNNNSNSINNNNITNNSSSNNNNVNFNSNNMKEINCNVVSNQRFPSYYNPNMLPSITTDIEMIDDLNVKEEPLSPGSSCPPSPNTPPTPPQQLQSSAAIPSPPQYGSINVSLANMAAFTNTDLVLEHTKNGSLQLSPASQSLLKNQQVIFGNAFTPQRIVMPKLNIRMDTQTQGFALPPTPPSSSPSDDSEGNQSPEHHTSNAPLSPSSSGSQSQSQSQQLIETQMLQQQAAKISSNSRRSSGVQQNSQLNANANANAAARGYSGSSSRQPIHTNLISTQPKGSTGQLELTEEEKRTLAAEGYPIPTRLPLTKSEEKSLKKIRRKIKNKISAQESRRKKKEYMDKLERQVEDLTTQNSEYRKRVESLEDINASLQNQISKLQTLVKSLKKN